MTACAIAAFAVVVTFAVVSVNLGTKTDDQASGETKQARFDAYQNTPPDPAYTPKVVDASEYEGTLPIIENQDATPTIAYPDGYTVPQDLVVSTLATGEGDEIDTSTQAAKINYSGWNLNGDEFDSSISKQTGGFDVQPGLPNLIDGWKMGLMGKHKIGDKLMLVIPQALAYKDKSLAGPDDTTASGPLTFFVEFIG